MSTSKVKSRVLLRAVVILATILASLLSAVPTTAAPSQSPSVIADTTRVAEAIVSSHFTNVWDLADGPVARGEVSRSWLWGPDGLNAHVERYAESPNGQRLVQYFDKSRMEITNPNGDPNSTWYVTNGLLVVEMISGRIQIGDNEFEASIPASVNIAGDLDGPGPTFAQARVVASLTPGQNPADNLVGSDQVITEYLRGGNGTHPVPDTPPVAVGYGHHDPTFSHNIAEVFWTWMNTPENPVRQNPDGSFVYPMGHPITEPYWTSVHIAGVPQDVLFQCFERRCITYNPANTPQWQVEMGNVGRQYYLWRYPPYNYGPTWSPDGTKLAWTEFNVDTDVMVWDGTTVFHVTTSSANEHSPTFTNEVFLYFVGAEGGMFYNFNDGSISTLNLRQPVRGPNGLITSLVGNYEDGFDIVVNRGKEQIPVAHNVDAFSGTTVKWAPDSSQIAYMKTVDGRYVVEVVGVDGIINPVRTYTETDGNAIADFEWMNDDVIGVSTRPEGQLCFFAASSGEEMGCWANLSIYQFDVEPTERRSVAFTDGEGLLCLVDADGGSWKQLSVYAQTYDPEWDPSGERVAYTDGVGAVRIVYPYREGDNRHLLVAPSPAP